MISTNAALNIGQASNSSTQRRTANNNPSDDDTFLATFDPSFIHRVLVTDPSDFSSLSSGASSRYTLSFEEFCHALEMDHRGHRSSSDLDPSMMVKKAVRDHVVQRLLRQYPQQQQQQQQPKEKLAPICDLLLEAHQAIRSLIPNRKDLHSMLDDEAVKKVETRKEVLPFIAKAAIALSQLESESRAVTTRALINGHLQNNESQEQQTEKETITFLLNTIIYLLYKTELCQADKEDYYVAHVWAPRIHREGPAFVKNMYQKKYGAFSDSKSSPATRQWIQSLVMKNQSPSGPANPQAQDEDGNNNNNTTKNNVLVALKESPEERKRLIRSSWIKDILFRSAASVGQQDFQLPEVFLEDKEALQSLREVTRLAVAGSALILHASSTAPVKPSYIVGTDNKYVETLVNVIKNHRSLTQEVFENRVCDAVIKLVHEWNPELFCDNNNSDENSAAIESLKSRTLAVLRGEDPVLQLLNNRVRVAIGDIITQRLHQKETGAAPLNLRSGIAGHSKTEPVGSTEAKNDIVEKLLCQRGLGAFASELALVAKHAGNIVDLAIGLYGDDLLDKIILDSCHQQEI